MLIAKAPELSSTNDNCGLVVLPTTPSVIESTPHLLGKLMNQNSLELLVEQNFKGSLIVGRLLNSLNARCRDDSADLNQNSSDQKKEIDILQFVSSSRALFIPYSLNKVVLFKSLQNLDAVTASTIARSLVEELKKLSDELCELTDTNASTDVEVVICVIFKIKGKDRTCPEKICQCFEDIKTHIKNAELPENLIVNLLKVCGSKNKQFSKEDKQNLQDAVCSGRDGNDVQKLMGCFISKYNVGFSLDVTDKRFGLIGGGDCSLKDQSAMSGMFEAYFPGTKHKLETFPDVNTLQDNLLHLTDEQARIKTESSKDEYLGEVYDLWTKLIARLDNPVGLLLKSFQSEDVNKLLQQKFNARFQFDWIYCGKQIIIAFEVARTNNPEWPASAFRNKLLQVVPREMPVMQLLLYFLLRNISSGSSKEDFDTEYKSFLETSFRIVIYFSNSCFENIKQVLNCLKEEVEVLKLESPKKLKQKKSIDNFKAADALICTPKNYLDQLLFMIPEESYSNACPVSKTYQLNSDLELIEAGIQVDTEICFNAELETRHSKSLRHVSALLTFSRLLQHDSLPDEIDREPLERDKRYAMTSRRPFLDIILSPQQKQILEKRVTRKLVVGEPGSGKTALLLAEAKLAAQDDGIETIYFTTPEEKSELRLFLTEFLNEKGNEKLKSKFQYVSIRQLLIDIENESQNP